MHCWRTKLACHDCFSEL